MDDGHLTGLDAKVEEGVGGCFIVDDEGDFLVGSARDGVFKGAFYGVNFGVKGGCRRAPTVGFVPGGLAAGSVRVRVSRSVVRVVICSVCVDDYPIRLLLQPLKVLLQVFHPRLKCLGKFLW